MSRTDNSEAFTTREARASRPDVAVNKKVSLKSLVGMAALSTAVVAGVLAVRICRGLLKGEN